jgi:hypothetical protein
MDLTICEDNQINLPATFNSWRTSLNQKFHMNMMKQQVQKRSQQEQRQFQQIAGPSSRDPYCQVDFSSFIGQNCMEIESFATSRSIKSIKKIKSENAAAEVFYASYGNSDVNSSLSCALGQVITESQL